MKSQKRKQKAPPKKEKDNLELQAKQSINSTDDGPNPTRLKHYDANNIPLPFIERINRYSNLIVGIATVLLVFVTSLYIFLSWKIANETKRLADISIEQFKIRSYPTFLIFRTNPTWQDGKYKDEITIQNKGEISSHKTSFLIVYAILTQEPNQPKKLSFLSDWAYVYKDTENIEILDYSKNILPNSGTIIGIEGPVPEAVFDNLKFQIFSSGIKCLMMTSIATKPLHLLGKEEKKELIQMRIFFIGKHCLIFKKIHC